MTTQTNISVTQIRVKSYITASFIRSSERQSWNWDFSGWNYALMLQLTLDQQKCWWIKLNYKYMKPWISQTYAPPIWECKKNWWLFNAVGFDRVSIWILNTSISQPLWLFPFLSKHLFSTSTKRLHTVVTVSVEGCPCAPEFSLYGRNLLVAR